MAATTAWWPVIAVFAAARAGKTEIPALVLSDGACAMQVQLAENSASAEDLNPLERALAVKAYMDATDCRCGPRPKN